MGSGYHRAESNHRRYFRLQKCSAMEEGEDTRSWRALAGLHLRSGIGHKEVKLKNKKLRSLKYIKKTAKRWAKVLKGHRAD